MPSTRVQTVENLVTKGDPLTELEETGEAKIMTATERENVAASAGTLATETIGRSSLSSSATTNSGVGTYVFASPAQRSGWRRLLRVRNGVNTAATLYLQRFTYDADAGTFTPVAGSDYYAVAVPAGPANYDIDIALYVARGEYIGVSVPVAARGLAYATGTASAGEIYYSHNVSQPAAAFVPSGGKVKTIQLQVGFDGNYDRAADDAEEFANAVAAGLADLTTATDETAALAASTDAALASVTETVVETAFEQASATGTYTTFKTGTPSSPGWACGWLGTSLPENESIAAVSAVLHRDATAVTFEATLHSRPIATTTAPSGSDTQVWTSAVSVDATQIAASTFGEVTFEAPNTVLNDPTKAYYLSVVALDADGAKVAFGMGNAGSGASLGQVQRGYYRNAGDTLWNLVGSTASLAVRVSSNKYQIASAALPDTGETTASSAPSKTRGTLVMWGRAELTFDNSGLNTFRRVFALPANVSRVLGVIFAHATLGSVAVTRAAIAPLASAANFAASGVTWTPLTFDGGAEGGALPASPSNRRNRFLATDETAVELLDRTDVTGAAKLVIVSAYLGGGGSPVLLGKSGTDDYALNWAAREDFPSVMRHDTGDCVTTPANFTETTNDLNGTPIAGLWCEADDGQILTFGAVGDSITNGAGISSSSIVRYGLGWVEKTAYALNRPWRGVLPVMLGWSSIPMDGIANQAIDFYSFCLSKGVPVPNLLAAPLASPNSTTVPLTAAVMEAQRPYAQTILDTATNAGSVVLAWTMLPVNSNIYAWHASDSYLTDYNQSWRDLATDGAGLVIVDQYEAMKGVVDSDNQMQIAVGRTTDGIHPNAAGHDTMSEMMLLGVVPALPAAGFPAGTIVVPA